MDAPLADDYRVRVIDGALAWSLGRMTFSAFRPLLPSAAPQGPVIAAALFAPPLDPALELGPAAGLAVARRTDGGGTLLSVYVQPASRGARRSLRLVAAVEAALAEGGATRVDATVTLGTPGGEALARILAARGWTAPERRMLSFRTDYETVRQAPWMRDSAARLPGRIVPWTEVAADFHGRLADDAAVPADLSPVRHAGRGSDGAPFEPGASAALLIGEMLAGWVLVHRLSQKTMRVTISYVMPALQSRLAVAALWRHAVLAGHALGYRDAVWTVPVWHPAMLRFAERRMAPYCTEVRPIAAMAMTLDAVAAA